MSDSGSTVLLTTRLAAVLAGSPAKTPSAPVLDGGTLGMRRQAEVAGRPGR